MPLVQEGQRVRVLDVPVDVLSLDGTVAWVERHVRSREPVTHLCVNAANVVRAHEEPAYRDLLDRGDVVGADGQPFQWVARMLGQPLAGRVAGIDLMERVLDRARQEGWSVYLLGAQAHVVDRLAARLRAAGIGVAGHRDGYFRPEDADEVAAEVAKSGADVLFVGMPTPGKEEFIVHHAGPAGVPVCIGVGGSFDVLAGELRRAPRLLQRIGLEWLFRLAQEPRRLFSRYAVTNTKFLAIVARAVLGRPGGGVTTGR